VKERQIRIFVGNKLTQMCHIRQCQGSAVESYLETPSPLSARQQRERRQYLAHSLLWRAQMCQIRQWDLPSSARYVSGRYSRSVTSSVSAAPRDAFTSFCAPKERQIRQCWIRQCQGTCQIRQCQGSAVERIWHI